MNKPFDDQVERRSHIERFADSNILQTIYEALPEAQKEPFCTYRAQWAEVDRERTELPFPLCISLELVAACNLSCGHCVRNRPIWRKRGHDLFTGKRLGLETVKRIVDECAREHLPSLWLGCSGEALLEKDLCEMLAYAMRSGIPDLILTTNGTLLTPGIIDRLLAIPLTRLNVSVDAFTPATYQQVRGGDLNRVTDSILYLLEQRAAKGVRLPVVRLTFIDMPVNRHEKDAFIAYWRGRVDLVDIQKHIDFDITEPGADAEAGEFPCSCPWRLIDIMANGDLVPCNSFYAFPELVMGNIHQSSIKEIWDSEKFGRFRNALRERRYTRSCLTCFAAQDRH